jgi:zinc protease
MMEESTSNRTALEAEAQAESLGAEINTGSSLDTSSVNLSALRQNLEPSVALFADIVRNPAFADDEVERQRLLWLAEIRSELSDPVGIALRTLPPLLYGDNHAYGIPFTGTGTAKVIRDLQRADLEAFYSDWLQADNATLFVVGDTTTEEIVPILEKYFGDWKAPKRERPQKTLTEVALPDRASFYFADRPGAPQSLVMASHLAPPTGSSGTLNLEVMNDIFGGGYNARVNQVIRIEKGWAYGAYTWLPDARGQRPWLIYAPVQTDRTADAMAEMMRMMRAYQASEPATSAELQRVVQSSTNSLPGQYETAAAVMAALLENQRFGRPDDYVTTIKSQYTEVSLEDVRESARTQLHPLRLTWVVVGDLTAIRPEIDALLENLDVGEIRMLDLEED